MFVQISKYGPLWTTKRVTRHIFHVENDLYYEVYVGHSPV